MLVSWGRLTANCSSKSRSHHCPHVKALETATLWMGVLPPRFAGGWCLRRSSSPQDVEPASPSRQRVARRRRVSRLASVRAKHLRPAASCPHIEPAAMTCPFFRERSPASRDFDFQGVARDGWRRAGRPRDRGRAADPREDRTLLDAALPSLEGDRRGTECSDNRSAASKPTPCPTASVTATAAAAGV